MFVTICVLIAAAIFAAAAVKAFRNRHAVSRRITILLAGICLSSFFLFLPCYWEISHAELVEKGLSYPPGIRSLVFTLYYSLKAIGGGQEIGVMEKLVLNSVSPLIRVLYFALNYGFFLGAPLLTSSLIISLIGDLADQFRIRIYRGDKYHVYSELNENTLRMAKTTREKHPKEMVVFCNTKNAPKEQIAQAKAFGAVLLHAPCTTAKLPFRNKNVQFYLVCENDDLNLRHTEELIRKYRDQEDGSCLINAFAESGSGIQMVENMDKGQIGVRFVDTTALFCSNLLLRHPVYRLPKGRDTISVAIVGCDKLGLRLLKTITWCGVVVGHDLKIRVYDKNADFLKKKLAAQCPELMANCDVDFVSADAQTSDLEERILDAEKGSPDATYILMATGDDELNISVATRLSRLFRHHNNYAWMPRILARIRNSTKSDVYKEQENAYLKQLNIHPFGGVDEVFADGLLHHSYLENLSFAVDLCYNEILPEQDPSTMTLEELHSYFSREDVKTVRSKFLQSEYNRRSSMGAALHIPVKLYSCGILPEGENIPTVETARRFREALKKDPTLLDALAKNEHLRWNRFQRSEGYVQATWEDLQAFYPTLEKKDNQDPLSKRHLCLVEWDQLDELNRLYMSLNPPKEKKFKQSDYNLVSCIPSILMLANRMDEIDPEDL